MNIILIPGLWLSASSWDPVLAPLRTAGHEPHPLTMPGFGAQASATAIGMADWVASTVAAIDAVDGDVVLVGHSGGGNVAWGAADARPGCVARVIFIDTVPPPSGVGISEFPIIDGVVPFPGWDSFDEPDVADLSPEVRLATLPLTGSVPAAVPTDPITLTNPARYEIPVTMLMGSLDDATFRAEITQWGPFADEFAAIGDARIVRLGSGHWPQFSQPAHLAGALVEAISPA